MLLFCEFVSNGDGQELELDAVADVLPGLLFDCIKWVELTGKRVGIPGIEDKRWVDENKRGWPLCRGI